MGTDHILRGRYHRKPTVMDCFYQAIEQGNYGYDSLVVAQVPRVCDDTSEYSGQMLA